MFKSSKRLIALLICLAMVLAALPMAVFADGEETSSTTIYLKPNSNWSDASARFAAYFFVEGGDNVWVDMVAAGDGMYSVVVPEGDYANVILCRMNPKDTSNSWDTKWNQTNNLAIPTDENNIYVINDGAWGDGNSVVGQWIASGEEPEPVVKEYYLVGTMNEWTADTENGTNKLTETGEGTGIYTVSLELAAGSYEYKAATSDWADKWPNWNNATLTLNEDATVTFTLNTNDNTITASVPDTQLIKLQKHNESKDLRLLASVDDLAKYASVTFTVTIGDITNTLTCENAYSSLIANGSNKTAAEVFGEGANYFVMYTIENINTEAASEMIVSVTWNGVDGSTTSSNNRTIDLTTLFG